MNSTLSYVALVSLLMATWVSGQSLSLSNSVFQKHRAEVETSVDRALDYLANHLGIRVIQDRWIINGCWHFEILIIGDFHHGRAQDFARTGFGQTLHHNGQFERRDRTNLIAHHFYAFCDDLFMWAVHTCC